MINNKMYKMHVRTIRGPSPIIEVRNHEDQDVTEAVNTYLGPSCSGQHHIEIDLCSLLKTEQLTFELSDGSTKIVKNTYLNRN